GGVRGQAFLVAAGPVGGGGGRPTEGGAGNARQDDAVVGVARDAGGGANAADDVVLDREVGRAVADADAVTVAADEVAAELERRADDHVAGAVDVDAVLRLAGDRIALDRDGIGGVAGQIAVGVAGDFVARGGKGGPADEHALGVVDADAFFGVPADRELLDVDLGRVDEADAAAVAGDGAAGVGAGTADGHV